VRHPPRAGCRRGPSIAPPHRARYPTRLRTRCTLRAMYCATTTSPHARYSVRDAVPRRHAGRHASAHPSPDPHCQPHGQRLRRVPALRDTLDQCAALTARPPRLPRSSGPPATPPASAARATAVPHRWRRLRRLFIRHHLLSSQLDTSGWAHPQHLRQPLSTAHAAFVASPRTLAILSAVPSPLKTCPWHAP
jgi:hypothetical protein